MTKKQDQAIKDMPQEGFHFSEEGHLYVLDGKPLTGVTTILGVIAKPALIQWAADETAKFLGWYNEKYDDGTGQAMLSQKRIEIQYINDEAYYRMLCDARVAHSKRKTDAGAIGTNVHAEIERIVKKAIKYDNGRIVEFNPDSMVNNFCKWAMENRITFLESEKRLYSREYWYAGTTDILYTKGGKKFIGDIKTSSAIYPEMFMQMAGYQIALEEQGVQDILASTIIRCGKDGTFEVREDFDLEKNKKGFLAALTLYRVINN